MKPSEVYSNSLFMQIIWMRLPDRSLGWETSNGKKKDYGYLILKGHFLLELSRHNALEIFFQVFSFKEACTSSACASPTPPGAAALLCQMLSYVSNCSPGAPGEQQARPGTLKLTVPLNYSLLPWFLMTLYTRKSLLHEVNSKKVFHLLEACFLVSQWNMSHRKALSDFLCFQQS